MPGIIINCILNVAATVFLKHHLLLLRKDLLIFFSKPSQNLINTVFHQHSSLPSFMK